MTSKPLQDAMLLQIFLSHYLRKKNSVVICLANGLGIPLNCWVVYSFSFSEKGVVV